MREHIGVARAAALLGLARSELQLLIRRGDLHTFEGQLDLDELRAHFPCMVLDQSPVLERVNSLRDSAFTRRVRSEVVASHDSLEQQLRRTNAELAVADEQARRYRHVLEQLSVRLTEMQRGNDGAQQQLAAQINRWLLEALCDR